MGKHIQNAEANNEQLEALIWQYIDGTCAESEKERIETLIADSSLWRLKYQELLAVHQSLNQYQLEQPSMRFTKNVMEQIAQLQIAPAAKEYINKNIIWGIAGFFITTIAAFIIYAISQINWYDSATSKYTFELNQVNYRLLFNNSYINIFVMVNIVLALFLLDKALESRKKSFGVK